LRSGQTILQPQVATAWPPDAPAAPDPRVEPFVASRAVLGALAAVFACRLIAATALVPPWQGPDEPTHFALAKQFVRPDGREPAAVHEFERQILQSMARHDWWGHYERPTPNPFPDSFSDVPNDLFRGTPDQPVYYRLAATVLRLAPGWNVDQQYFLLRGLSIVLTAMTIALGWLGTKALFGTATAIGTLTIVTFHPQFLLSAMSVNPDVLINFCGALIWWQVARLLYSDGWRRVASVLVIVAACALAALSKRNGLPLVVIAFVAGAVAVDIPLRRAGLIALLGGGLLVAVTAAFMDGSDSAAAAVRRLIDYWTSVFRLDRLDTSTHRIGKFAAAAVDTAWLTAGWLRFPPPEVWAWVVRVLTIAGFSGAVAALARERTRKPLVITGLFVAIHFGALLTLAFTAGSVPQGRYLFAVLFPAAALIWVGWGHWLRGVPQVWAIVGMVCVMATLDLTGFLFVLLPAYAQ
jgi:hypothetical protein